MDSRDVGGVLGPRLRTSEQVSGIGARARAATVWHASASATEGRREQWVLVALDGLELARAQGPGICSDTAGLRMQARRVGPIDGAGLSSAERLHHPA